MVERHTRGTGHEQAARWVAEVDEANARLISATRHLAGLGVPAAVVRSSGRPPADPVRPD